MAGVHPRVRDQRGSNRDRAVRRQYIWDIFRVPGKNYLRCFHCSKRIFSISTRRDRRGRIRHGFVVDRYPVCGHAGGTYRRNNIVPSCFACNGRRAKLCKVGKCPNSPSLSSPF